MSYNTELIPAGKNETLWLKASKRAGWKRHFIIYLLVNAFIWAIYFFSNGLHNSESFHQPWPIYTTLGWGLGLLIHFVGAYEVFGFISTEKEYERLNKK